MCGLYGYEIWTINKKENDTLYWGSRNMVLVKSANNELGPNEEQMKHPKDNEGNTIVNRCYK